MALLYHLTILLLLLPAAVLSALHTSGRWIVDANNQRVKFRCVNWAGHTEARIPEGLQHQPVDYISAWIARNEFNCVRLTYSVDMALNPNQTVAEAFSNAAETTSVDKKKMQDMYVQATQKNAFLKTATVLETFSEVVKSLEREGIYVILDNHVSKASWCCGYNDGNGWFGEQGDVEYKILNSRFFDPDDWLSSLNDMGTFSKDHPNIVGMSLRNELRALGDQSANGLWYKHVSNGAKTIHAANSDLLIVIGGTRSAGDLRFLKSKPLDTSEFANRTVWEFHTYSWSYYFMGSMCPLVSNLYGYFAGFLLHQNQPYTGPLWLSEFGVGQTGGPNSGLSDRDYGHLKCIVEYMSSNDADWAYWALQGSYYIREGHLDSDESYGLLTKDWKDWRNPEFPRLLGAMWNSTQTDAIL